MKAEALICREEQSFEISEVTLAEPGENDLVVRTTCSGVSVGTEFALIRNRLSWGPFPICTGYQAVGVVEQVGSAVVDFAVGQKVYYRAQPNMTLPDGTAVTSACGLHCSHAVLGPSPTHGSAALPEGVDEAAASLFVMAAVGQWGVDMAGPRLGEVVVVHGTGMIGLGVVAACALRGCVVVAVDVKDAPLAMARRLGADHAIRGDGDLEGELKRITPDGADIVFECTGLAECITPASELARRFGKFVYQGNYGGAPIGWDFLPKHGRQLTTFFPCDDGLAPCRRAVLRNMARGALPWSETITHRVPHNDAAEFYARINAGNLPGMLGAVIRWS